MKILVTGHPGSGKTIFAKYLKDLLFDHEIIEFDEYQSYINLFYMKLRDTEKYILVIQHKKLLNESIDFDKTYQLQRFDFETLQIDDGSTIRSVDFLSFEIYMTS